MDRAERVFAAAPEAVGAARRFAQDTVLTWGVEPDDTALIVSELTANAVLHARTEFTLRLIRQDAAVTVEVTDQSAAPVDEATAPGPAGGHGLIIVDRLAEAWGSRPTADGGKTVWARLDARAR